eukprot:tig00020693_g13060.t1
MFNAQTANISSEHNRPYGRNDVDFSKGNPFGAMLMDQQGTRALRCRRHGRASFSVQEHIEMTKKKEQSVKKALGSTCRRGARRGAVDVDEKKQVLRQIAQYRRSFGGELTSTKKLSLARRWTS